MASSYKLAGSAFIMYTPPVYFVYELKKEEEKKDKSRPPSHTEQAVDTIQSQMLSLPTYHVGKKKRF